MSPLRRYGALLSRELSPINEEGPKGPGGQENAAPGKQPNPLAQSPAPCDQKGNEALSIRERSYRDRRPKIDE